MVCYSTKYENEGSWHMKDVEINFKVCKTFGVLT